MGLEKDMLSGSSGIVIPGTILRQALHSSLRNLRKVFFMHCDSGAMVGGVATWATFTFA